MEIKIGQFELESTAKRVKNLYNTRYSVGIAKAKSPLYSIVSSLALKFYLSLDTKVS